MSCTGSQTDERDQWKHDSNVTFTIQCHIVVILSHLHKICRPARSQSRFLLLHCPDNIPKMFELMEAKPEEGEKYNNIVQSL